MPEASITIGNFPLTGNEATADARQKILRKQRLADGNVHDTETGVLNREIWVKTANGWKLKRIDNERVQKILVEGVPSGGQ